MRLFITLAFTVFFFMPPLAQAQQQSEEFKAAITALESFKQDKSKANWDAAKKAVRALKKKLDDAILKNNPAAADDKETFKKLEKESTLPEAVEYNTTREEFGKLIKNGTIIKGTGTQPPPVITASRRRHADISFDGLFSTPEASTEKDFEAAASKCVKSWLSVDNPNVPETKINEIAKIIVTGENPEKAEGLLRDILKSAPKGPCDFIKALIFLMEMRKGYVSYNNYGNSLEKIILNGQIEGQEVQVVFRWMDFYDKDSYWLKLAEKLRNSETADPWLKNVILGKVEIDLAWESRGNGWAKEVTQEGWKGFYKNLKNAEGYLKSAYEMYPARPEAAELMMSVKLGSGGLSDRMEWFRKALDAQVDYIPVYHSLQHGFRPRWGGSEKLLMKMAAACLDAPIRNPRIQYMGLSTCITVNADMEGFHWQNIYRLPGFREKVLRFAEELRAAGEKDQADSINICIDTATGHYDEAEKRLNAMTEEKFNAAFRKLCTKPYEYSDILLDRGVDFPALIKALTGPEKEKLGRIIEDYLQEKETAPGDIVALIKSGKLSPADKKFAADLYGKMMMPDTAFSYYNNYRTALNIALTQTKDFELIQEILELGADPNATDWYGNNSVILAARKDWEPAMMELLKKYGADLNFHGAQKNTAINNAIASGKSEIADTLIALGADINSKGNYGNTALITAIQYKNPGFAGKLIKLGADVNAENDYGTSPLNIALYCKTPEIFRMLLDAGANVNTADKQASSVLMRACCQMPVETIEEIIKKGAKINAVDNYGFTPLHWASLKPPRKEVIGLLLKNGADVNARTKLGETPLMVALRNKCDLETVKLFANAGADLKARDKQGQDAKRRAQINKENDIIKYLEENK